jgi:hypothetical protein
VLIPPAAYVAAALGAGMGAGDAVSAMITQIGGRPALLTPAVLTLAPILVYLLALRFLRRRDPAGGWLPFASWAGLIPSLMLIVWANLQVWPSHLPGMTPPGWPHGLELVIVPIFWLPFSLVLGTIVGGLIARSRAAA